MNNNPVEITEEKLRNGKCIYYARVSFGRFHGKTGLHGTREEAVTDAESLLETCRLLEKTERVSHE